MKAKQAVNMEPNQLSTQLMSSARTQFTASEVYVTPCPSKYQFTHSKYQKYEFCL